MLSPSNEEDVLSEIYYLTQETTKNWRKLVKYGQTLEFEIKSKVLWVWPTEENLREINQLLKDYCIVKVLSIGCGNGLFEWLLKEALDLQVYGLEVDSKWWHCNYAINTFIPLNYIEDMNEKSNAGNFLQQYCATNEWNFALMFCYFNDRLAFLEYLKHYGGNHIIIVGPSEKSLIYSDPLPLEPHFPENSAESWILTKSIPLANNNILVLYQKYQKLHNLVLNQN